MTRYRTFINGLDSSKVVARRSCTKFMATLFGVSGNFGAAIFDRMSDLESVRTTHLHSRDDQRGSPGSIILIHTGLFNSSIRFSMLRQIDLSWVGRSSGIGKGLSAIDSLS
jgi:hypothetical protein